MLYQSPVAENYTNQTLLTLYNYDVAFVALDKTAYNQSQFTQLGGYLYSVFGSPVYNDNTTIDVLDAERDIQVAVQELRRLSCALGLEPERRLRERQLRPGVEPGGRRARCLSSRPTPTRATSTTRSTTTRSTTSTAPSRVVASSAVPQKLYIGVPTSATNYSVVGYENLTSQFAGLHAST